MILEISIYTRYKSFSYTWNYKRTKVEQKTINSPEKANTQVFGLFEYSFRHEYLGSLSVDSESLSMLVKVSGRSKTKVDRYEMI